MSDESNVTYFGEHAKKTWSKTSRFRPWCFTHHDYTDKDIEFWKSFECEYMLAGKEICPTTGRPHLQGMFNLKDGKTFSALKKLLPPTVHYEPCRCPLASIDYCKKDGDFFFQGRYQLDRVTVLTMYRLSLTLIEEQRFKSCMTPILASCYATIRHFWNIGIEMYGPGPSLLQYIGFMDQQELENLDWHIARLVLSPSTLSLYDGGQRDINSSHASSLTTFPQIRCTSENCFDCLIGTPTRLTSNAPISSNLIPLLSTSPPIDTLNISMRTLTNTPNSLGE